MTADETAAQNRKAALWVTVSMAAFAVEDTFLKIAAVALPPGEVLVINGVIGGGIFWLLAAYQRQPVLSWQALRGAPLVRNLAEAGAAFFYILAMALIPVALISALFQATPLMVTAGAALFLGETVGWRRWCAILVGLIGVLIILQPWSAGLDIAGIAMVLSVICVSIRDIVTRRMPSHIGSMSLSAWGVLANIPAGLLLMAIMGDSFVLPDSRQAMVMGAAILFGLIGYYIIIFAMRIGEVSAVAPFRYTRLVFNILLAMVFLGETLSWSICIGAAVVVSSGLYMFSRMRIRAQVGANTLPQAEMPR